MQISTSNLARVILQCDFDTDKSGAQALESQYIYLEIDIDCAPFEKIKIEQVFYGKRRGKMLGLFFPG